MNFSVFAEAAIVNCMNSVRRRTFSQRVTARHIGKIVGGMTENRSRTKIEKRRHVRNTRAAE